MGKARIRKPPNKTVRGFIIAFVALALITAVLLAYGDSLTRAREEEQLRLKTNVIGEIIASRNQMRETAGERYEEHVRKQLGLMTASLSDQAGGDGSGSAGRRVFEDGFVAELLGNEVLLPAGAPEGLSLSRELIENSLASGAVLTGRDETQGLLLSFGKVADNLVYVQMTPEEEYTAYMDLYQHETNQALVRAESVFGGTTLILAEQEGKWVQVGKLGEDLPCESPEELGLTQEMIRDRVSSLKVNGEDYECTYLSVSSDLTEGEEVLLVQLLPHTQYTGYGSLAFLVTLMTMLLVFSGLITYIGAAQRRVFTGRFTPEEWEEYRPSRLRKTAAYAAISGLVLVLIVTILIQGISRVYIELEYSSDALNIAVEQLKDEYYAKREDIHKTHESWYIGYGERMAELLSDNPDLSRREKLQEYCDGLGIDFIMLFDGDGRETACSRAYEGFTLSRGVGANASDFQRLLMGIPYLVHETSADTITGLERQMIGVTVPPSERMPERGALIMALEPDTLETVEKISISNRRLAFMTGEETLCLVARQETGEFIAASDPSFVGKTVQESGLTEETLKDGYMDLTSINGVGALVITAREGDAVFYYAVRTTKIFSAVLLYMGLAGLLFALGLTVVLVYLFHGYSAKKLPDEATARTLAEQAAPPAEKEGGKLYQAAQKLFLALGWRTRTPEDRAKLLCRLCLILVILNWAVLLSWKGLRYREYDSLGSYLLMGNWSRGLNLFAFNGILLVTTFAYVVNLISSILLRMLAGFLQKTGDTICTLIRSGIKYIAILVSLYFALTYIGIPIGPVIGSLGIVSIALSLGAQDLASDIIAGLFIVFEGSFHVGDYIEIKGSRGYVREIGVRSTVLVLDGNNVKTINNHLISEVVNLSGMASSYVLKFSVPCSVTVSRMEELLARELPEISQKCDKLIGDLTCVGISDFGRPTGGESEPLITFGVQAKFLEQDRFKVQSFVRMEIYKMLEREGITPC